jgi:tetratricopeptide (TPR) repeat protein
MSQDEKSDDMQRLRRAVLNDPRNAELRYLLAAEMAQTQDYEGAVLEFSAAIALNPMLHVARLQLGLLHLTLAQTHHTIAVLAPLEDLADDDALKYFKRGLEALIKDEFDACVTNLQQGIALNTTNAPLNVDMQLLVDKVVAVLAEREGGSAAVADPQVRTDFSLYNEQTRH